MQTIPEINNAIAKKNDYSFGCGKDNPIGLKLDIEWDGETSRAEFIARKEFQGGHGYLHGGITTCVMDETMCVTALKAGFSNLTARINVRFRKKVPIGNKYLITCQITRKTSRLIETIARFTGEDGTLYAEGTSTQFVVEDY